MYSQPKTALQGHLARAWRTKPWWSAVFRLFACKMAIKRWRERSREKVGCVWPGLNHHNELCAKNKLVHVFSAGKRTIETKLCSKICKSNTECSQWEYSVTSVDGLTRLWLGLKSTSQFWVGHWPSEKRSLFSWMNSVWSLCLCFDIVCVTWMHGVIDWSNRFVCGWTGDGVTH